jgi:hypothetical protein
MKQVKTSTRFNGDTNIQCDLLKIKKSFEDIGRHFTEVTSLMPGMSSVELVEKGSNYVIIKTNEGIMKRTNIIISKKDKELSISFDEEYAAGKKITATSQYAYIFHPIDDQVRQDLTISNVKSPGILGFFYKNFGGNNIGKAVLKSYKDLFEQ